MVNRLHPLTQHIRVNFKHPSNVLKALLLQNVWSGTESGREVSEQEVIEIRTAPSKKKKKIPLLLKAWTQRQSEAGSGPQSPKKAVTKGGAGAWLSIHWVQETRVFPSVLENHIFHKLRFKQY